MLKQKAKMDLVFLRAATLLHVILFAVSCLQQGALDRRRDRSATRLEVIFHRKGFLPTLDPSNLTRHEVYKTRFKGIWRCVENVSISCLFLYEMATYVPSQPRIRNPHSYRNFLAKIYAKNCNYKNFTVDSVKIVL